MKFSEHIGKGAWAFASRGLPLLYAIALIAVARVIPKEEFGVLAVFQTFFTMIFSFSDSFALQAIVKFGVEPEVVIEELVTMTTLLFLAFLGMALAILLLFPGIVSRLLNIPQLEPLMPYLAIFALFTTPRVVFSKVLQMRFRMKEIFFVDFANFGIASIILVIMMMLGKIQNAESVIRVTMVSGLLSSLVAIVLVRPFLRYRPKYSRAMLARISEFVRYQAAAGLVSSAQQNFDILIVSGFMGAVGVGVYNGAKMLFRGFYIIRDTMILFVFPATSKYHSRGEIGTLRIILEKSVSFLTLGLIPLGIVLAIGAPFIFHILYGVKYDASIPVFRVLLISILFFPMQTVFNAAMAGMGKIKEEFWIFTVSLVVNVILSAALLAFTHNLVGAAVAFAVASGVQSVQLYFYIQKHVGLDKRQLWIRGFGDFFSYFRSLVARRNEA
ncbi:MAG TPA: oligosaccharide flippase family protein [Candidatus Kapabacteria bacterium]|nr:oligosaccharide flippase family protein [Candidatus Kapabacteria bacterium]